jgi:hypothetical protein
MTRKQSEIYVCIEEFWKMFGYGPSVEDIQRLTGDKSRRSVHRVMLDLCKIGVCKRIPFRARSIRPSSLRLRDIK